MSSREDRLISETREATIGPMRELGRRSDQEGRFPREGVEWLGREGALGLALPAEAGGLGLGPRAFAEMTALLAEADASLAMIFVMHTCGSLCIAQAPKNPHVARVLREMGAGRHLTTLAFSEKGSRSHFWAPVSQAVPNAGGVRLTAQKSWVTSAGEADSYVVTSRSPNAASPVDSTLYLVDRAAPGVTVLGPWRGMGLRGNASAPMTLERVHVGTESILTRDGTGFDVLLQTVLPWFNLGVSGISLGICRATVGATVEHLKAARLEHQGQSLAEAYPTLRARVARMQTETDTLGALVDRTVGKLERADASTLLAVLEVKAAANETAIAVTSSAMRACGGAAYSQHTSIDRYFRDAHAGAVMAPTVDQLREFLGRAVLGLPVFG